MARNGPISPAQTADAVPHQYEDHLAKAGRRPGQATPSTALPNAVVAASTPESCASNEAAAVCEPS